MRGGEAMKEAVSTLAASEVENVPKIMSLLPSANVPQRVAISQGLRFVADFCGAQDAALSQRIEGEVLATQDTGFIDAYNAADNLGVDPGAPSGTENSPIAATPGRQTSSISPADPDAVLDLDSVVVSDPFAMQDSVR